MTDGKAPAIRLPASLNSTTAILCAALLLRILWALAVPVSPVSDGHVYDLLARSLAHGIGYCWSAGHPTAYWPVGTSFVYSLLYRSLGESYLPIVGLNILLSLATLWLLLRLATHWFSNTVAGIAGWIFACWPMQIQFTTILASELLFTFLLLLLLEIWEGRRLNPWFAAVLAGVVSAAACYVRPTALLYPALLFAITAARERRVVLPGLRCALVAVVMLLTIVPWAVRNTHLSGRLELISTNGGPNFWMGNNPESDGEYEALPAAVEAMPEGARDTLMAQQASAYIYAHPLLFVERSALKALKLHNRETIGVHWNMDALLARYSARTVWWIKLGSDLYWWSVLALALAGAALCLRTKGLLWFFTAPATIFWAYFTAVHAATVIQDRYHFPCQPFIATLAAVALSALLQRMAKHPPSASC